MTSKAGDPAPRVVWTRGKGCRELAELLGGADASRVQGDPMTACVEHRADLLVSRRLPSTDSIDMAIPLDLEPLGVASVVAAVAGGPHSMLAARVARRLGLTLGVPASMVSAHPADEDPSSAVGVIEEIYPMVPDIDYQTLATSDMAELVEALPAGSLLVFGAPGGSWFQRRLFGPGARLRSQAPTGAVVVQSAPRRVFQVMGEPVFVAPLLHARDMLRMHRESTLAVAENGRLIGLVRRASLTRLSPDTPVGDAMEEPLSVGHVEPVDAAEPLKPLFGSDPIPVVDGEDHLVGGLSLPAA